MRNEMNQEVEKVSCLKEGCEMKVFIIIIMKQGQSFNGLFQAFRSGDGAKRREQKKKQWGVGWGVFSEGSFPPNLFLSSFLIFSRSLSSRHTPLSERLEQVRVWKHTSTQTLLSVFFPYYVKVTLEVT